MMSATGLKARRWPLARATALGFAIVAVAYLAAAQAPSGPIAPKPGQAAQMAPAPQQPARIRVKVDLVNAPVVVRDAKGELVLSLTEENFHIFDNGVLQKIEGFEMGGAPLSVAIVVETSSRVAALLPAIRRTGVLFTQTVLGDSGDGTGLGTPGDATVIGYGDEVNNLVGFTSDRDAIEKTFTNLKPTDSGARLYDALSRAVGALRDRPSSRRRVIIVMAEAIDTGSEEKLGQVLREAQLANITIYSIGLSTTNAELRNQPTQSASTSPLPPGVFGMPPMPGSVQTPSTEEQRSGNVDLMAMAVWTVQHVTDVVRERPLEIATTATGGLYQSTLRDSSIEPAIDQIGAELHAQYTLSYRPTGTDAGGYHEIMVDVQDRRAAKVRSRPGYYLGPPQG